MVAFANKAGGTIHHRGRGQNATRAWRWSIPLAVEEQAANLISDAVSPRLLPDIELLRYRDTHVLAIRVFPSSNRPHYLGSEPETGAYVRVGSTNRRADAELVAEMRRFSRRESFDERPMLELDSEALDFRAASESFAEFRRLTKRDLDILGLRTSYQGRSMPTVGGMLLYGCNRLAYFPDALMQAGKFAGHGQDGNRRSGRTQDAVGRTTNQTGTSHGDIRSRTRGRETVALQASSRRRIGIHHLSVRALGRYASGAAALSPR